MVYAGYISEFALHEKYRNGRYNFLIVFCFLLSGFTADAQSPWTQGKAGFYIRASWQTIPKYSTVYDGTFENGKRTLERRLNENTLQLYGEYGITRKTTVLAEIPLRFARSGAVVNDVPTQLTSGTLSGFGNIGVALRQNFSSKKLTFSGQLRIDLPGGRISPSTGLSTGFDAWALTAILSLGRHYGDTYWFVYGGGGGRGRVDNHYLNAGAEAGIKIKQHWLIGFSDAVRNTGSGVYFVPPSNVKTGLYMPDQGYWMLGGKGILAFNRFFGGNLFVARPITGDLIPRQTVFTAGLYFRWD